ncbi:FecR domain-containing protein [Rhizobium sp. YIM 134829]|uniref:FecR domain-containing protein n=1 Tax=Rhizobium sp. YIM 134829 TaxID=3390453 RepID=UPI003978FDC2
MGWKIRSAGAVLAALALIRPAAADPVARGEGRVGAVIARKSGEEIRFVDVSNWRVVDLRQDVVAGDVLRTNATGQLALLFDDHTQIRLGRNTALRVKDMRAGAANSALSLESGTIWARAERGGQGLTVATPAATAAIRGTDWTLSIGKGGQTSLTVLDGEVELSNAQGSVRVRRGEGAVAAIGQAPRKIFLVTSDDREQMLYYLALRDAFPLLPASTLTTQAMKTARHRIAALPEHARTAEDWLTLAEVELTLSGRAAAASALSSARAKGLGTAQTARADFLEAMIAASENRFDVALTLFARARPGLDAERRSVADHAAYFARSLADPAHVEAPPKGPRGAYGALAEAYTIGFRTSIRDAAASLKRAEVRYPDNPLLPAARAKIALVINDRAQAQEAYARALALDPTQSLALDTRGDYIASVEGRLDAAVADLRAAVAAQPGDSNAWNTLGLLEDARGNSHAALEALKTARDLDPQSALYHANLAIFYLEQMRFSAAKAEIDLAMAADPGFDMVLFARGRYNLQTGKRDQALEDLLAASVANPGVSFGQALLAAAHLERGDREPFEQALDNADRLDPNDPLIPQIRAAAAIDDYQSDEAIRQAQEFLKRGKARGGDFGAVSANRDAGSVLNDAFRFQGLDAWGQYYGDVVFDPFQSTAYFDQAIRGTVNPFVTGAGLGVNAVDVVSSPTSTSSLIQGLLLDPQALASSERRRRIIPTPFIETSLGIGVSDIDGETKTIGTAEVQALGISPIPISLFANFQYEQVPGGGLYGDDGGIFDQSARILGGTAYVTASPTADDRLVAYGSYFDTDSLLSASLSGDALDVLAARKADAIATSAGLAWSHSLGDRNVVNLALFHAGARSSQAQAVGLADGSRAETREHVDQRATVLALNHMVSAGDVTWRYGVEGGRLDIETRSELLPLPPERLDSRLGIGKLYLDGVQEISPTLQAQYGLYGTLIHSDATEVERAEPRAGIAWAPAEGQWLRAAFLRQSYGFDIPTLAPTAVVGIQPNAVDLALDGRLDTWAARWDAQWTDRLFTALDFQHQTAHGLSIDDPASLPSPLSSDVAKARIDRAALTANYWLGGGFGLSGTIARVFSKVDDPASPADGRAVPYVAESAGQIALTYVSDWNYRAQIAANYFGPREDSQARKVGDDWTLDANFVWEPLDKRVSLEVAAFNLLNEDITLSRGVPGVIGPDLSLQPGAPGAGRSVRAMLKVRF